MTKDNILYLKTYKKPLSKSIDYLNEKISQIEIKQIKHKKDLKVDENKKRNIKGICYIVAGICMLITVIYYVWGTLL